MSATPPPPCIAFFEIAEPRAAITNDNPRPLGDDRAGRGRAGATGPPIPCHRPPARGDRASVRRLTGPGEAHRQNHCVLVLRRAADRPPSWPALGGPSATGFEPGISFAGWHCSRRRWTKYVPRKLPRIRWKRYTGSRAAGSLGRRSTEANCRRARVGHDER
jgi:hypothetical protein